MASKVAVPFCIPTSTGEFLLLHIFANIWCCVLDFSHSNTYIVVSSCFNLQFLHGIWSGPSFNMLICNLYILFGEVSVKVLSSFFVLLLLNFMNSLCILGNSPLSDLSFADIFSQSLFPLFSRHCLLQFFILMKSYLSIISFTDWTFGVISKNS